MSPDDSGPNGATRLGSSKPLRRGEDVQHSQREDEAADLMFSAGSDADLFSEELHAIAHAPPRRPRSDLSPDTPWGPENRYRINDRLGRGAMGTVYAATDTRLKRTVALKVLDALHVAQDADHPMLREAQLAARMEHDRIARVYDVGTHERLAFVAMEHVPGGTLRQWMSNRDRPVPEIVDIATQIAEGLAELHAKSVIHRDLKPENVMLTTQGGVKLVDFGLARNSVASVDESSGQVASPHSDLAGASVAAAAGTPGYMAPEQCAGRPFDARVDIFALGVIIHELVTGERLYRGATATEIMAATLERAPVHLDGDSWERVPERLRRHTARMLAHDPDARFANGSQALAALRELTGEITRHRSWLPPATAQAIGKAATQVAISPLAPGRIPSNAAWKHVARSVVVAALVLSAYALWLHSRQNALPPPPPGMALIDGGEMTVGRDQDEIDSECRRLGPGCDPSLLQQELPRLKVTVAPFYLDKEEVTNEDFVRVLDNYSGVLVVDEDKDDHYPRFVRINRGANNEPLLDLYPQFSDVKYSEQRRFRVITGREKLPVSLVSWYGAKWYCESQGKRLPAEDEWEAAARGTENRLFPWGDNEPRCSEVIIKNDDRIPLVGTCGKGDAVVRFAGVAAQDITLEGVRNLGGNVAEWTSSFYAPNRAHARNDASSEQSRVVRGGSWASTSLMLRTSARKTSPPLRMAPGLGFRCASNMEGARP